MKKPLGSRNVVMFLFSITSLLSALLLHAEPLTLLNAGIISGNGEPMFVGSIIISDGKIERISETIDAPVGQIIDLAGLTLLPGLIDSHVHLQAVPGSAYRDDSEQVLQRLRKHHLRAYVASGVTTVLDAGISAVVLRDIHSYIDSGGIGPRVLALAPVLYTPGGYLDGDLFHTSSKAVTDKSDILDLFKEYQGIPGIVGMKVPLEYGFGPVDMWPVHSKELRETISNIAIEKGRPVYVHATSEKEQIMALNMGARTLVHSGFWDESPSDEFLDLMIERNAYLITTLSGTLDLHLDEWHPERLDDPLIRLTVPEAELSTLDEPGAWEWSTQKLFRNLTPPWLPDWVSEWLAPIILGEPQIVKMLGSASHAVKIMYEQGIPIVVGTDSGSYPTVLNFYHGPSTIREMELLSMAGIPNMAVITSATSTPAKMLGIDRRVGTIQVGQRADILIASCDPIEDISCLRHLQWVIKGGVIKTPAQWMAASSPN